MTADPAAESFEDLMPDEDPNLDEVMACVFGIQAHEVRTYRTLLDNPGSTVAELATALDRDRSNVNRSLSTLRDRGLASRERRLLDGGGHVYQYTATPLAEARDLMHEALDQWTAAVHDRIDEFDASDA
ncbi:helix-turn-helix domain-containing protein [Haloarcula litorea]|uniref:helix-turn-helix domain-containing protein n=1 Tax=Haloarcula litorea TaxID=3032579 RepID=UPI0023E86753|nr:helix-turn-helix domain-containing protein [Halomicroarcula sp. GDY20]